jgi:hypothetical protein
MSLTLSIRIFEVLLGWSLLLQTLEYLRVQSMDRVAIWPILQQEIPARPAWIKTCLNKLFQPRPYTAWLCVRLALSMALMLGHIGLIGALLHFLMAVLLLLRWRGAFNGGSDFMTLVAISGLLLAHVVGGLTNAPLGWQAGLGYICLQTVSSYFVSGWVKLLRPEWRSGRAMTLFLDTGVYGPLPEKSLFRNTSLAKIGSWSFTLWEGCFPIALLDLRLAWVFCFIAAIFHLMVFAFFGLNRFFWAWIATFPAVLYCSGAQWA